jgi:hypothetical protein
VGTGEESSCQHPRHVASSDQESLRDPALHGLRPSQEEFSPSETARRCSESRSEAGSNTSWKTAEGRPTSTTANGTRQASRQNLGVRDISLDHLRTVIGRRPPRTGTYCAFATSRVLAKIGAIPEPLEIVRPFVVRADLPEITEGVPPEWAQLCRRWFDTSTGSDRNRRKNYYFLLNIGRWLTHEHPEINSPADWTRELAAEAVAVTCQWHAGDWCTSAPVHIKNRGHALKPSTYAGRISALRVFFRDLQEWELIPRRFDPVRSFVTPKSVLAKIGSNPRVIADDVWAKLVWAGLNLTAEDLPKRGPFQRKPLESSYPVELCKALAVTWLFAGLRNNEISRLRLGCIRWRKEDVSVPGGSETLAGGAVCMLDVPVNKTSTAFTKPVDPIVGDDDFRVGEKCGRLGRSRRIGRRARRSIFFSCFA